MFFERLLTVIGVISGALIAGDAILAPGLHIVQSALGGIVFGVSFSAYMTL